ncbi:MAG: glycosyltransferase family 9 protein, partial [Chloroflexi bacterium]
MGFPALNFTGRTTLGGMGAVLSRSQLLVCNDTGVSHLAAALRVPSVITFVTSNPQLWAPLDHDLHRAVGRLGHPPRAEEVIAEARRTLRKSTLGAPNAAGQAGKPIAL